MSSEHQQHHDGEHPSRISVSRDALRADLAEMELRLRMYFDDQLRGKADNAQVLINTSHITDLRRGELTDALRRAVTDIVEETVSERTDRGWTSRERIFGVIALAVMVMGLALSIYVTASAAGETATPDQGFNTGLSRSSYA